MTVDAVEVPVEVFLNRAQVARALGVSEPTVDRYIADGMPVAEKGSNGKSYKFDLNAVLAWRRGEDEREAEAKRKQEQLIAAQQLQLLGGGAGTSEMALTPEKRRAVYDAEFAYRREAEARGELMKTVEVEARFEEAFKFIGQGLQSLPDVLARKCSLPPEAVAQLQLIVDGWQEDLATMLQKEDRLALDRVA